VVGVLIRALSPTATAAGTGPSPPRRADTGLDTCFVLVAGKVSDSPPARPAGGTPAHTIPPPDPALLLRVWMIVFVLVAGKVSGPRPLNLQAGTPRPQPPPHHTEALNECHCPFGPPHTRNHHRLPPNVGGRGGSGRPGGSGRAGWAL